MYGLNVVTNDAPAYFMSRAAAYKAVAKLVFVAHESLKATVGERRERGQHIGYCIRLNGKEGEHVITDGDVERFGL